MRGGKWRKVNEEKMVNFHSFFIDLVTLGVVKLMLHSLACGFKSLYFV